MSDVILSKDVQDTGYGERHFKQVGNPLTGAAFVEFPAGAAGAADALEATQLLVKTAVQDIDTKTPALGQALAAASIPVVLTAAQLSALAPLLGLTDTQLRATAVPVLATLSAETTKVLGTINNAAGEAHLGEVAGNLIQVSAEITLLAASAYTAGDVVSDNATTTTPLALPNIMRVSGGTGYLVGLKLATNTKSITPRIRVHFFNVNTATIAGDNVAFKELYADSSKRCGYWDMPSMITATDTTNSDMSRSIDLTVRLPIKAVTQTLYAVFEALDAVTFTAGGKITLTAWLDNN